MGDAQGNRNTAAMNAVTTGYQISQLEVEAKAVDLILQRKEQLGTTGQYLPVDRAAEIAVMDVLNRFLPVPKASQPGFGLPKDQSQPPLSPSEQAVKAALAGGEDDPRKVAA